MSDENKLQQLFSSLEEKVNSGKQLVEDDLYHLLIASLIQEEINE
jgi:hypothetical protein